MDSLLTEAFMAEWWSSVEGENGSEARGSFGRVKRAGGLKVNTLDTRSALVGGQRPKPDLRRGQRGARFIPSGTA